MHKCVYRCALQIGALLSIDMSIYEYININIEILWAKQSAVHISNSNSNTVLV